jgi:class 3 adenylate cyclase
VTFLFTDVEGSTRLLKQLGRDRYGEVLAASQRLVADALKRAGGYEIDKQGDASFFTFASAVGALAGAAAAQRALAEQEWPEDVRVSVRMGVHTGEATVSENRYLGLAVHRAARVCEAAHGGQVLLSATTRNLAEDDLPAELTLLDVGERRLKDSERPERLFQLAVDGLPVHFPPPRALAAQTDTAFAGREAELAAAAEAAVGPPALRISDADRDRAAIALREHCVEGRLTLEEFSARLDTVYAATTREDLDGVMRELPARQAPPAKRKRRRWLITPIGSDQRRGRWLVPDRMIAISLLGSPDLDFRKAVIANDEVRITSFALIGALTAIVPPGIDVDVGGFALIGGNDVFDPGESSGAARAPGAPVIRIRCFSLVGGAAINRSRRNIA